MEDGTSSKKDTEDAGSPRPGGACRCRAGTGAHGEEAAHQDLPEAACTTGRVRRCLGRVISPSASQPVLVINFRFRSPR